MDDPNEAIVIDNGSGTIKAGFAGATAPKHVFQNIVGRRKYTARMQSFPVMDHYVGDQAQGLRGLLSLRYPMEHGIVTSWDDMQNVWWHTFYNELRVSPEEHRVLLTESPLNPKMNKIKTCEVMFETFNVAALNLCVPAVLALYASGRTTGVVLDSGDGVTHIVPISDGYIFQHAVTRLDVAGRDLSNHFIKLAGERGYTFTTTSEMNIVRDIKEKLCYVALDFQKELQIASQSSATEKQYELPDGQIVTLESERFRCAEAMFLPSLLGIESQGIHELTYSSIMKCSIDSRKNLYENIVIVGGNTMFPGMKERLQKEMSLLAPAAITPEVCAPHNRNHYPWIGGSIWATQPACIASSISRAEYNESGPDRELGIM